MIGVGWKIAAAVYVVGAAAWVWFWRAVAAYQQERRPDEHTSLDVSADAVWATAVLWLPIVVAAALIWFFADGPGLRIVGVGKAAIRAVVDLPVLPARLLGRRARRREEAAAALEATRQKALWEHRAEIEEALAFPRAGEKVYRG